MNKNTRIGVIGGGSWGTAIVKLLLNNVDNLNWWVRKEETAEHLKRYHHNPNYLSYVKFDIAKLTIMTDMKQVINESDLLIFVIPSAFLKESIDEVGITDLKGKVIVSAIKGIIPETNTIVGDFFFRQYGIPYSDIGIIGGPCHSEEVAMERLSFLTVAFQEQQKAEYLTDILACRYMRVAAIDDIFGTEYAAVLKNIFAIANGMSIGLGYGDNFQSVLIVNAIQEINRFINHVHPVNRDINSPAYIGDLIVTAYSQFSRNRTFGIMIGKGYSVKSARMEMKMVAEGYYSAKCIREINSKQGVYMPITDAVYNVLYEGITPFIEMKLLADKLN